jgi:phytoene dehydrogenase-like protein
MIDADCIVVGAGLAGLACARALDAAGRRVLVVEAADRVGGRVATDEVEGFRIDRGFQVYNDAYPEGRRQLDLALLNLGRFDAGALVAEGTRLRRVADPWRQPIAAVAALLGGTIGLADGVRTARLRSDAVAAFRRGRFDPDGPVAATERTTAEELAARGFSAAFIRRFFVPFFGGVFLERSLETAAPVFLFDFAMFALGRASLPAGGMAAIPAQLAAALPAGDMRLGCPVRAVAPGAVELASGERLAAAEVVVATDRAAASRLVPAEHGGAWADRRDKATRLVAFAADRSPLASPTLVVNAAEAGPIDNLTVPSDVAAGYAPAGASLVTVSVREGFAAGRDDGENRLADAIRDQAAGWFGPQARSWRELAVVHVRHALPDESPAARRLRPWSPRLAEGLWICGDHCATASINGALASGRKAAEAVLSGSVRAAGK